ncbi:hypothetical protein DFR55_11925 [Herbinix hemicellulosilytica]|uniref:Putative membrane protein n=1 Tax=Herbinix hemicellulosilytica TaxID=1564487 RepID=A0A0H5SSY2_HERHM|nr:putative glycoside hydrolase [Herbinix hemicellulosilytica]RBP57755.1 hypothetical protein DFR55_11925 [Herbinix hemicellulosilytica]CRZ33413.1 putative membrane protein [Herbinix hemicellulosilytica]
MRKKNEINMYIDYKKTYRKRRRGYNTFLGVIIVFILAVIAGLGTYYAIRIKTGGEYSLRKNSSYEANNGYAKKISELEADNTDDYYLVKDNADSVNGKDENINEKNHVDQMNNKDEASDIKQDNKQADNTEGKNKDNKPENGKESNEVYREDDPRKSVKVKGIYVTSLAIMYKRDQLIEIADSTEINAMVIDVKDDNGRITFNMENTMAHDIGATTNTIHDIADLMKLFEEKNIYPIARIVAFKDPYLAENKPEYAIKNKDGTIYRDNNGESWVNPYNKEVWDYLIEISTKAAEVGFKEIQFDYIRFSTGKGMSDVDFGPLAEEKTKEEIILEFTKYAYEKLKPLGVFVSADVYGTIISSTIDASLVGQNYVEMARYLDYICPMIYPSHFAEGNYGVEYPDLEPYQIIRKVLMVSREKLEQIPEGEHKAIVRPWLQDFTASWIRNYQVYTGKQVREQIEAVYASGYREWLLWNAASNYSVDGLYDR